MNTFFAVRVLFCSIYVLFPRVLHEYGRITTVHERHVTEEVFMYSLWSNYIYIHRELWHYSKKPFLFQALEIVSQVLTGFFGILLPAGILLFLEQSSGFSGFALGTLVLFLCYAVVFVSHTFLQSRNAWQYTEFRTGFFTRRLLCHFMQIDYAVLTEPKTLQLAEKAVGATCSNWVGVEGMFRYDVTIYSSFLGLILYAGLIGTVHPAIILLLLVLSVLQFLSYRRAASYEVRRRDDLSEIEVSQRYFQKQSYNTSAGKDIRLYQLNGWLDGVYRQLNKRYQKILFRIRSAYFANDLLTLTLQLLRDGICYGFLIYRLSHGTMTVSGFVLALGAVSGFSSYFNEITAALSKSVLCLEQIRWLREFFDLPFPAGHTLPFRPELAEEKPLEICFSHVSFSHPGGDKRILDDVSFTLHAGEHTALVGINGAGKSTIVKLICGLYQPTEGNITINGIPLGSLNPAQYYKAIAAVFQDPFALSFSIAENVSCSPLEETDRNRCREALIRAGLWEKIASLPQKEETYLGKDMADDGITLSGGEMQKLMMARALYKNCHLLLLDEPTAALDAISENKMYETYSTLLKNKTALFISHRLASTRFCDTILFLENGKAAITLGSTASLKQILQDVNGSFEVGTAYFPTIKDGDEGGVSIGGASLWALNNNDDAKAAATWKFIKFLISPESQAYWNAETGYFPVTTAADEEQTFKDNVAQYPQFQTAIDQLHDSKPQYAGALLSVFPEARQIVETEIENMINGNETPEKAVESMASQINSSIEDYNLVNE